MRSSPAAYSAAQKVLHWGVAALVLGMVPVGVVMTNLDPGPAKNALYELHKSFGLIALALGAVRLAIRVVHGAPALVPGLPAWQRLAAKGSHHLLYALLLVVPLSGWLATSACCAPVNLFWQIPLTAPVAGGMEAAKPIFVVHVVAAFSLTGLAAVHIGAALMHHFVRRDPTLLRMLPQRSPKTTPDRPAAAAR